MRRTMIATAMLVLASCNSTNRGLDNVEFDGSPSADAVTVTDTVRDAGPVDAVAGSIDSTLDRVSGSDERPRDGAPADVTSGSDARRTGKTFYVSPAGDDTNDGLSPKTAWKTTGKVNEIAWEPGFAPGETILFEGGQSFTGTLFFQTDRTKGLSDQPIILSSYGQGRAKIVVAASEGLVVYVPARAAAGLGFVVRNLIFVGDGALDEDTGRMAHGILMWTEKVDSVDLFHVEGCEVTGFSGNGMYTGRATTAAYVTGVVVRNSVAHHNPGFPNLPDPSGSGIVLSGTENAVLEHSIAYENGSKNTNSAGPVGLWSYDAKGTVIQFNESYRNRTGRGDGGGFDIDGGCTGCTLQYNYSHDNDGAGFLLAQYKQAPPFFQNTIRYNISQNDAGKHLAAITIWGASTSTGARDSAIYNNTVYISNGRPGIYAFGRYQGIRIWNNVIYLAGASTVAARLSDTATTAISFLGNAYRGSSGPPRFTNADGTVSHLGLNAWRKATGQERDGSEVTGLEFDGGLAEPGQGGTFNDTTQLSTLTAYRQLAASPLTDSGLDLKTRFGIDPGLRDFWGNPMPTGPFPDVGAHEAP